MVFCFSVFLNPAVHCSKPPESSTTHPYLRLLLFCGVNNGGAADLSKLATLTIKRPTADLVSDHIFDEEDAAIKPQHKFVKQFNVLQQVIIRVAGHGERQSKELST